MSRGKKILEKIKQHSNAPLSLKWKELVALLNYLGFKELPAKGGGSGYRFINEASGKLMMFHRPHPKNQVCKGAIHSVLEYLKDEGYYD